MSVYTLQSPMEEDRIACTSPIVSQYAAQLYGQPSSEPSLFHTTHLPAESEHTTPEHITPVHTTLVHNTPQHTSPEHTPTKHNPNSPIIHNSPVFKTSNHASLVNNQAVHTTPISDTPSGTPPFLRSPSSPPAIYDATDHRNSPPPSTTSYSKVGKSSSPSVLIPHH